MSSELFTSGGSGGVHLHGSSAASAASATTSEVGGWETVGSSRRRVPASSASVSSTGARAGSTATPTKFNPNAYGNPVHSSPASRSTTPSKKSSAWAKPKNNWKDSRPRASANDDKDDEAPAVSAAPTPAWESDSDDDDDDE
jgi:hypothetical protein